MKLFSKQLKQTFSNLYFQKQYSFSRSTNSNSKNPYEVLSVNKSATAEEIKGQYYKLAKQYHPDINKGSDEKFKEINQAYEILGDEEKRKQFDFNAGINRQSEATASAGYQSYHYGKNYRSPRNRSFYETSWQSYKNQNSEQNYYKYDAKRDENFFYEQYKANMNGFRTRDRAFDDMLRKEEEAYQEFQYESQLKKWKRRFIIFPLFFLVFFFFIEILPKRNSEYVIYDDKNDKVYVVDRNMYKKMLTDPRSKIAELQPEDLRVNKRSMNRSTFQYDMNKEKF